MPARAGQLAHLRCRLYQAAIGGHVGERDQLDPIVEQPPQGLQVHLSGLVALHYANLGPGTLRHLQKRDVVACVFVGRGHDAIAGGKAQGIKGHFPGPGRVLLQRDFFRSAMQQPRHAAVQRIEFGGDTVGRLVAAYLLLQPKMLDDARDDGSRLQARAGVVEEDRLLAARSLRSQPRDVPDPLAWLSPILHETLYC